MIRWLRQRLCRHIYVITPHWLLAQADDHMHSEWEDEDEDSEENEYDYDYYRDYLEDR